MPTSANLKENDTEIVEKRNFRRSTRRWLGSSSGRGISEALIAPGFGTKKDLQQLSKALSEGNEAELSVEAVEAIMRSGGRGMRSSRRNKGDTTSDDSGVNNATEGTAGKSAWADFMKDEGYGSLLGVGKATKDGDLSTRKAEKSDDKGSTTEDGSSETKKRPVYDLEGNDCKKKAKTMDFSSSKGILVQSGTLDCAMVGRSKAKMLDEPYHLLTPTRILPNIYVKSVYTSSHSVHSIACDIHGNAYGWGRNECNQLTSALPLNVAVPTLLDMKISSAALGKSHTLFLLQKEDNESEIVAVGMNKSGQCGINRQNTENVPTPKPCVFSGMGKDQPSITEIACGEDFSLILDNEGFIYSSGSSEFGQLGDGDPGEYFVTASKMAFRNCYSFKKCRTFCHAPGTNAYQTKQRESIKVVPLEETLDIRVQSIACGKHHSLALEAPRKDMKNSTSRVFSWGCGDYGVLGHGVQADEYYPRVVASLAQNKYQVVPSTAKVSAGSHCSLLLLKNNGYVYYWGNHRGSLGEAVMKPQLIDVLVNNQHNVSFAEGGGQTVVCSTSLGQTIVWGQGQHGELGLGSKKSSAKPAFVESLDQYKVMDLACGYGHTLWVLQDSNVSSKSKNSEEGQPDIDELPQIDSTSVKEKLEDIWKKMKKPTEKPTKGNKKSKK